MITDRILFGAAPVSFGALLAVGMTLAQAPSSLENLRADPGLATLPDTGPFAVGRTIAANRYVRADDGLFYVTAQVNGAPVRFLLDTGANMIVLTEADAQRAGAAPLSSNYNGETMETAGGPSPVGRVMLDHVAVAGHEVRNVNAIVAQRGLKVSLLGQDLLSRLGPVTISGDSITLSHVTPSE